MKKVRMGVIGLGAQGGYYMNFLAKGEPENIEVTALCDIDPAKKAMCAEKYPGLPFYTDYIEMLESGKVDAVVTCVPHFLHIEMGINALKRNIHALVEKPAGVYAKQVRELNEFAASKPNLTFGIMFNQRGNPLYQKLKEIVDSGEIGSLRRANWIITTWWRPQAYYDQSAWRATWGGEGGGVLVNQAPHQIDLMQWICGMPKKVYSNVKYGYQRNLEVEDEVTAVFDYGNGATGVFITCTHDMLGTDRFEIFGDKGKIVVEGSKKFTVQKLAIPESEFNKQVDMETVIKLFTGQKAGNDITTQEYEFGNTQAVQHPSVFQNFAANILDGTPLLAPGSDGIKGVSIANAIHMSSWLGKEVEMPVDEDQFLAELNKRIAKEGKYPTRN